MSLKSSTKSEKANLWTLEVSIDAETFEEAQKKAFAKMKNRISIPGFRKGKVPRHMAEKFYGEGFLYEDALEICYPNEVEAAIKESELDVVGTENADIKSIGKDGVELTIEVYTKPDVEVKAYKGLEASVKKLEVTDEEIQSKIDSLVERNARIITVEDRAAADGDITVIDFEGFTDGVAFDGGKGEDYELTLGSGTFIPGFEDQIIGHNAGEEFDVNVTFPTEYDEKLADKDAVFKVKLKEIKFKELPEVNDEFAQDAADCDTVDDLKKQLKEEVEEQKKSEQDGEIRQQVFEQLAENVVADIPHVMVDDELDNQIRDLDYRLSSQGMNFSLYLQYMGMTLDDYKEKAKDGAEKNVKIRLALEKIAELEKLEVSDVDLETEYAKYAEQYNMEVEQIKNAIPADGLKKDLTINKAVDFIVENAVVTEKDDEEEKQEEETAESTEAENAAPSEE
ncbi:MAG: trigger factor [Acutalibacteraceae bacterium]